MLYAVKDENGKIWHHTVAPSVESAWSHAMFPEWMTTGKIDVDDFPGSVARYQAEAEGKGRLVVPVEIREIPSA